MAKARRDKQTAGSIGEATTKAIFLTAFQARIDAPQKLPVLGIESADFGYRINGEDTSAGNDRRGQDTPIIARAFADVGLPER